MSIYKFFNLYSYNRLNYTDFFHLSFFFKCNEQHAWISNKQRVEFGLPLPPKKPLTGFFEFAQIRRPELLQTQPHLSQQEIMKLIAKDWHNLNTEQKLLVKNKSKLLLKNYCLEYEKYKKSLTIEQQDIIKQLRKDAQKEKQLLKTKRKCLELNKPKKPVSIFIKFWLDKKYQRDKNIKQTEWIKLIATEWMHNTSDFIKEQYRAEYLSKLKKYKSDITAWEEKMIRERHTDVIHPTKLLNDKI